MFVYSELVQVFILHPKFDNRSSGLPEILTLAALDAVSSVKTTG